MVVGVELPYSGVCFVRVVSKLGRGYSELIEHVYL